MEPRINPEAVLSTPEVHLNIPEADLNNPESQNTMQASPVPLRKMRSLHTMAKTCNESISRS